jgi:tRNA(fMet)-specific endonuclease VapC
VKILLDTNAYAELKRGHEALANHVRRASRIVFSTVVLGELLHGFRVGSRYAKNLRELESFLDHQRVELLPVGRATADRFGRIASRLQARGTPIPANDIWIAAHVMESGAELVTFDRHFRHVEGLPQWDFAPS